VPAIKGCIYISTHFLTSQPTLIKLDNENIGGHLTPLQSSTGFFKSALCMTLRVGVEAVSPAVVSWGPNLVSYPFVILWLSVKLSFFIQLLLIYFIVPQLLW